MQRDVTHKDSVERACSTAIAVLGGLHGVVNVAGGDTEHRSFEDTGDDVWLAMTELNLLGVVRYCRAAIPT